MTVVGAGYSFLDEVWAEAPPNTKARKPRRKACDLANQKPVGVSRPYALPKSTAKWGVEEMHPDMKPAWESSDREAQRRQPPHARDDEADDAAFFDTALAQGVDSDRDGMHDYAAAPAPAKHRRAGPEPEEGDVEPRTCDRLVAQLDEDRRTTLHEILRAARDAKAAADAAVALIRDEHQEKSSRSKSLDLVAYVLGGLFTILVLEQFVQLGTRVA